MKRMNIPLRRSVLLVQLLIFALAAYAAPSVRIYSDLEDGKVEVDQTFHITIEATDCPGSVDVSSKPAGIKIVYRTTRQTSKVSTVNGKTTQEHTTSLIMTCKGETVGKYTFGPVTIDGRKSNTLAYQVVPSTGSKTPKTSNSASQSLYDPSAGPLFVGKGNEEMYLKAYVNKTTAYEQEAIEYTVKLFTTYGDIKFLGAAAAPKFDGFVVEESPNVSTSFKFEDVGGKTFKTAVIARYIIFPQKAGSLKITGNTYTVSTDARQYYHDPYFQTITVKQPVQLNVTPNEVVVNVKELPTPIPDNFIGGVGRFYVSSSMPVRDLKTNTAVSLDFKIEGTGNVKYVKLPDLSPLLPKSFEVYSPEVTTDVRVEGDDMTGSANFDYSLIPREAGTYQFPEFKFTYFDPVEGSYKEIRAKGYDVNVSMGQSSSKSQQTKTFDSDLMPVGKTSLIIGEPYINSILYWLWYIVPVIIFALSLGFYRRHLHRREDMVLFRSKNANKIALKRLSKASQCIKNNQEEQFYDEMLSALWGYLADKLKIPTSELNRSNVGEEFKTHGVQESTFQPIINLIDECEYAKYTPVSRGSNMRQLYADALETISKIESEYDRTERVEGEDSGDDINPAAENYINTTNSADKKDATNSTTDTKE